MKGLLIVSAFSIFGVIHAQDSIVSLDALSAPQSPAANLMGFTDSEILKPETPTDFMTNIKTASNGFSLVPNSFAVDLRLKSLIRPSYKNSFSDYIRTTEENGDKVDVWNNMVQTSIISIGYKNYGELNDSLQTGQGIGIGFKTSFLRGSKLTDEASKTYEQLIDLQRKIGLAGATQQQLFKNSKVYKDLSEKRKKALEKGDDVKFEIYDDSLKKIQEQWQEKWNNELKAKADDATDSLDINKASFRDLKKLAESFEFKTYGFFWDLAGGMVLDFPTNNFDFSIAGKAGIWTTFGYEGKKGLSVLGLGRGLYTPNLSYTNTIGTVDTSNVASIDAGLRILYEYPGKSFSLSAEGIRRGSINNLYDPMYRFTLNVGYEIFKNAKLTFMFGRDYDGAITRDGNIISALQFVQGFGGKKAVDNKYTPDNL